jgi:hypothetical protein
MADSREHAQTALGELASSGSVNDPQARDSTTGVRAILADDVSSRLSAQATSTSQW